MKKLLFTIIVALFMASALRADTINDKNVSVGWISGHFLKLDCSNCPLIGTLTVRDAGVTQVASISHNGTSATFTTDDGNISLIAPVGYDMLFKVGDNAGVNIFSFQDSDGVEKASIDSDGNIDTVGRVSVFNGASYGSFYHDGADIMISGSVGDITLLTPSDVNVLLSDAIGKTYFRIQDSGVSTMLAVDSNGVIRHLVNGVGVDYIYQTNNTTDAATPSEDGFKIRWKNTGIGLGANNDALIFDKTDANDADPDGAIQFVNTGSDGVQEVAMNIFGTGVIQIPHLTASLGVYTNGTSQLVSTPPTSGILGYWSRTGTTISTATAGDNITTTGTVNTNGFTIGTDKFVTVTTFTSAGINAAIDALGTNGGEVYLPEGDYDCTATITIDYNNTTLRGSGKGTRLLATNRLVYTTITGTPVAGQTMTGDTTGYTAVCEKVDLVNKIVWYHTLSNAANFSAVENISWSVSGADTLVNGSAPTEQTFSAITLGTKTDTTIKDMMIVGGAGGGNAGGSLIGDNTASTRTKVDNCYLLYADYRAINVAGDNCSFSNNHVTAGRSGGIVSLGTKSTIINNILEGGTSACADRIFAYGASHTVIGNIINTAPRDAIVMQGANSVCSGNLIYNTTTGYSDIKVTGDYSSVMNNSCYGSTTSDYGIYLDEADYCSVIGNVTQRHDVAGIQIDNDCQNTTLGGNNCSDTTPYVNNGTAGNFLFGAGGITINSAGDDKNINISHNDTNGLITSSDGTISFDNENLTTTGTITGEQLTSTDDADVTDKLTVNHIGEHTAAHNVVVDNVTGFADTTDSSSKDTGSVILEGGLGVEKTIGVGGKVLVANTTDSTTKDTGCVIVEGGIGVEKQVVVGTNLLTLGTTDASTHDGLSGSIQTLGGVSVAKSLYTGGDVDIEKDLSGTLRCHVHNSKNFDGAIAEFNLENDATKQATSRVYSSSTTGTLLGIAKANLAQFTGYTASNILYGSTGSDCNVYMGINSSIVSSWTSGTLASGVFNVAYTTPSTTKDTGALVVEGGLGVESAIFAGTSINAGTSLNAVSETLTGGTVTDSTPLINITQTVNDAADTFKLINQVVTNTASTSIRALEMTAGTSNIILGLLSSSMVHTYDGALNYYIQNLSSGASAACRFYSGNDSGVINQLRVFSSGYNTGTYFGITPANYAYVGTSNDADTAGLMIGSVRTSGGTVPIIFGSGDIEVGRFSSGVASTGTFSVAYTEDATGVTGTVGSIVTLGGISAVKQIVSPNLVNSKKGEIIELVKNLLTDANIYLFLIMDETGATTTIVDRSVNAHNATLGGNASTLTPTVVGLCPSLLFANAAATEWSIASHADFTFGNGAGTDSAFSVITLEVPTDATNSMLMGKWLVSTNEREWRFELDGNDKLYMVVSNVSGGAQVGRYYNTALTGDQASLHCYVATLSGGAPQALAGIKVYRDGARIDDTDYTAGAYAGMTGATGALSDSRATVSNGNRARELVQILVHTELSAATVKRISDLLLAYGGTDI